LLYTSLHPFSLFSSSALSLPKEIMNHSSSVAESKPEANSGSPLLASIPPFPPCKLLPTFTFLFNLKLVEPHSCCWEPFSYFEPAFPAH